jgi:hypothetical protein
MVRPDYRAVDHLQTGIAAAAVVKRFEHQLPQAGQRPTSELAVNGRPFAKMLMQIAPCHAGPRNPENPIKNKAMVPWSATASGTALDHERLPPCPFFVAQQSTDQGSFLKNYLESDTTLVEYPLCQHLLVYS